MNRDEGNPMNSEPVTGSEVQSTPKDFRLESGFIIQSNYLATQVSAAPRLLHNPDLGIANEPGTDEEFKDQRNRNNRT
jgi:hypothetical protein